MKQCRLKDRIRSAGEVMFLLCELEGGSVLCSQELTAFPVNMFQRDVAMLFSSHCCGLSVSFRFLRIMFASLLEGFGRTGK